MSLNGHEAMRCLIRFFASNFWLKKKQAVFCLFFYLILDKMLSTKKLSKGNDNVIVQGNRNVIPMC